MITSSVDTPLSIDRYTGEISFAVDYQVQNPRGLADRLLANVTAHDTSNTVAFALLSVTVLKLDGKGFPFHLVVLSRVYSRMVLRERLFVILQSVFALLLV